MKIKTNIKAESELNDLEILLNEIEGFLLLRDNRIAKRVIIKEIGKPTYWVY